MHSIHLHDAHLPKGPNLFVLSVGEVIWFSIALFCPFLLFCILDSWRGRIQGLYWRKYRVSRITGRISNWRNLMCHYQT